MSALRKTDAVKAGIISDFFTYQSEFARRKERAN
jgi:hypothetical protein